VAGLSSITDVGQRPAHDHAHRVIEKGSANLLV
jgi:hypothetical protein